MEQRPLPRGRGAWFEGWYFKHQGEEGGLALIPAIHRERRGDWTASLQVITPWESRMIPYSIRDFAQGGKGWSCGWGKTGFPGKESIWRWTSPAFP